MVLKSFKELAMSFTPSKTCEYCGEPAVLVKGYVIYPHRPDLSDLNFWLCEPCDAYVGCHKKNPHHKRMGFEPLGRLANEELRNAKSAAHKAFDPMWQSGKCSRGDAYTILAAVLDIDVANCHIGLFDVETCNKVVKIMNGGVKLCGKEDIDVWDHHRTEFMRHLQ